MLLDSLVATFNYVIVNAAGNIVLLIDAGSAPTAACGHYVRRAMESYGGHCRIDIVGFVGRMNGAVCASFWNPDGTHERMCGNACRSIPLALQFWNPPRRVPEALAVHTELCCARVSLRSDGTTSLEIPTSAVTLSHVQQMDGELLVDVGTPHVVRQAGELFSEEVNYRGERLSTSMSPVNATFCKVVTNEILARTFERGVGETKSCGTGAIAAMFALERWGAIDHLPRERIVRFSSGNALAVSRSADNNSVSVAGKCDVISEGRFVFESDG